MPPTTSAFSFSSERMPRPFDLERVEREWERWRATARSRLESDPDLADFMMSVSRPDQQARTLLAPASLARTLLEGCFGNSPFLSEELQREPALVRQFLEQGPDATHQAILERMEAELAEQTDRAVLMRQLRLGKRRFSLTAALADLAGAWTLETICAALSDGAETALRLSVRHLLREGAAQGALVLPYPDDPERDSGFFVLAMGKLGARELNFSSDIDLVVLFDLEKVHVSGPLSPHEFFVRLTRALVRIMEERTSDGYVFRTDLRLRPDPGSTALAMTTAAAETYYEGFGQNWERAAMIKARSVAGDAARGDAFIQTLRPFVWRRSLDFHAIQDIHSIKRQINAHHQSRAIVAAGHDVKLGRGGIREIEFFAQTQQLIWGGREPSARVRGTLAALDALADLGHIAAATRDDLAGCYVFLRTLEHRLQMIEDAQTQTLPRDPNALARIALFFGHEDAASFSQALQTVLLQVEAHYARLFGDAPSLSDSTGNLVFTGPADDPGTLQTLAEMGFANPGGVNAAIRGWHHGRFRSTRSTRARELLTELVPVLLRSLSRTSDPNQALLRFDRFLSRLPAGIQVFSLFQANPTLLDLVAEIMGDAPRLAEIMTCQPNICEAVITAGFFAPLPSRAVLAADLESLFEAGQTYEESLDACRLWANGRKFQVGVQTLQRMIDARQSGEALTAVADTALERLLNVAINDFSRAHGWMPDGALAVVALGKMGGREMTATSDLDLIVVYDSRPGAETSDGAHPLPASAYFLRLTQRFINAITVMTAEGRLYDVDMRLRPSGSKGPLAVSLDSFRRYHAEAARTWEQMALTRARVVCGAPALAAKIEAVLKTSLERPRDPVRLRADIADMRALMARERKPSDAFDVKLARGGLIDIEFIIQMLLLQHLPERPALHSPNVAEAVGRLREAGLLSPQDGALLLEAQGLWLEIQNLLRHLVEGTFREEAASAGLKRKIAALAHEPDLDRLKIRMERLYAQVYEVFQRLIEIPAANTAGQSTGDNNGET